MLQDISQDTPAYRQITELATQQELREGRREGLQEALKTQHHTVVSFVQVRFPRLVSLVAEKVEGVTELKTLQVLIEGLFLAQIPTEAQQLILQVC